MRLTPEPMPLPLPAESVSLLRGQGIENAADLRVYGNLTLLKSPKRGFIDEAQGPNPQPAAKLLQEIERATEVLVLDGGVLVTGAYTTCHRASAIIPLRWGAPRILVVNCGLRVALGENLKEEPFDAARLWRYEFDPATDLVISTSSDDRAGKLGYCPEVVAVIRHIGTPCGEPATSSATPEEPSGKRVVDMTTAKPPVLTEIAPLCECAPMRKREDLSVPWPAWLHGAVRVTRSQKCAAKLVCSKCGKETFSSRRSILDLWVATFGPLPEQLKLPELK